VFPPYEYTVEAIATFVIAPELVVTPVPVLTSKCATG
jgi:hypothetical protein